MDDLDLLGPEEWVPSCPEHARQHIIRMPTGELACGCGWYPGMGEEMALQADTEQKNLLKRTVWALVPTILEDLALRLDKRPETRATIVEALALAVALIDIRACRTNWDQAARQAVDRLSQLVEQIRGQVSGVNPQSPDEWSPAYLGTRGEASHEAAWSLAADLTGYLHIDLALVPEGTSEGYGQVVVDTMVAVAATIYLCLMQHELTPREERELGCYQVALWKAYASCYSPKLNLSTPSRRRP